jgi:ketosteroid isomerase-like protein
VLILRDVLDWPAEEVARTLELSVAAVNSALQRARATLREHLPADRREAWASPEVDEAERAALDGFIAAHEAGDAAAALALIAEDIRVTMPPNPFLYEGREAIAGLLAAAFGGMGEWRLVPTRANRMPAAASYLRPPGEREFRAFKLDVLRVRGAEIAEITTFTPELFSRFGLPAVL